MSQEKERSILAFYEKYAVDLVVKYMHHFGYLNMIKQKKEREKREKAERESNLTHEDAEWGKLLSEDVLRKQEFLSLNCTSVGVWQPKKKNQ